MSRKIHLREYEEAAKHWQATHPDAPHALIHRKALAHLEWKRKQLTWLDRIKEFLRSK